MSLMSMLSGKPEKTLTEAIVHKKRKEYEALGEIIKELTVKDVEFLEALLDALQNDQKKYFSIFEDYLGLEKEDMIGGSRPYQIISAKALAYILALKEGRTPTEV